MRVAPSEPKVNTAATGSVITGTANSRSARARRNSSAAGPMTDCIRALTGLGRLGHRTGDGAGDARVRIGPAPQPGQVASQQRCGAHLGGSAIEVDLAVEGWESVGDEFCQRTAVRSPKLARTVPSPTPARSATSARVSWSKLWISSDVGEGIEQSASCGDRSGGVVAFPDADRCGSSQRREPVVELFGRFVEALHGGGDQRRQHPREVFGVVVVFDARSGVEAVRDRHDGSAQLCCGPRRAHRQRPGGQGECDVLLPEFVDRIAGRPAMPRASVGSDPAVDQAMVPTRSPSERVLRTYWRRVSSSMVSSMLAPSSVTIAASTSSASRWVVRTSSEGSRWRANTARRKSSLVSKCS